MEPQYHRNMVGETVKTLTVDTSPPAPANGHAQPTEPTLSTRVSPDEMAAVAALAERWGMTRSAVVRRAVQAFVGGEV